MQHFSIENGSNRGKFGIESFPERSIQSQQYLNMSQGTSERIHHGTVLMFDATMVHVLYFVIIENVIANACVNRCQKIWINEANRIQNDANINARGMKHQSLQHVGPKQRG